MISPSNSPVNNNNTPALLPVSSRPSTSKSKPSAIQPLSSKKFEKRLNHLVASGVFNEDKSRRGKGLRQHVRRVLTSWENERYDGGIYYTAPTSIHALKKSLKNKRGMFS